MWSDKPCQTPWIVGTINITTENTGVERNIAQLVSAALNAALILLFDTRCCGFFGGLLSTVHLMFATAFLSERSEGTLQAHVKILYFKTRLFLQKKFCNFCFLRTAYFFPKMCTYATWHFFFKIRYFGKYRTDFYNFFTKMIERRLLHSHVLEYYLSFRLKLRNANWQLFQNVNFVVEWFVTKPSTCKVFREDRTFKSSIKNMNSSGISRIIYQRRPRTKGVPACTKGCQRQMYLK